MSPDVQTLLLLRHATAEAGRPGGRDADRRLTADGRSEAAGVGDWLRSSGLRVGSVLCSPAVRTRETLEQLGLPPLPDGPDVELEQRLYQASAAELLELLEQRAPTTGTLLVVGHSPAVPGCVGLLAGPRSSPNASAAVASHYPPGTVSVLTAPAGTLGEHAATLVEVRVPRGRDGRRHR